jgi:hypothetical protein
MREIACANGIVTVGDHAFAMSRHYFGTSLNGVHGRVTRIGPDDLAYSDPETFAAIARPDGVLYGPTFVVIAYFDGDKVLERHRFLPREVFVVLA